MGLPGEAGSGTALSVVAQLAGREGACCLLAMRVVSGPNWNRLPDGGEPVHWLLLAMGFPRPNGECAPYVMSTHQA